MHSYVPLLVCMHACVRVSLLHRIRLSSGNKIDIKGPYPFVIPLRLPRLLHVRRRLILSLLLFLFLFLLILLLLLLPLCPSSTDVVEHNRMPRTLIYLFCANHVVAVVVVVGPAVRVAW